MTAAVIVVAVLGATALAGVVALAGWLRAALRELADMRVADATKAGTIALQRAEIGTIAAALAAEKRRADALDDELEEVADDGDVAGARERVLQRWLAGRADPAGAADHGEGTVPTSPTAGAAGPSDDILAARV